MLASTTIINLLKRNKENQMQEGLSGHNLSTVPDEVFREIVSRITLIRDILSLMETSKVNRNRILANTRRSHLIEEYLPLLELRIEKALSNAMSQASLIYLSPNLEEDPNAYLFKNTSFEQKKQFYKIILRFFHILEDIGF